MELLRAIEVEAQVALAVKVTMVGYPTWFDVEVERLRREEEAKKLVLAPKSKTMADYLRLQSGY